MPGWRPAPPEPPPVATLLSPPIAEVRFDRPFVAGEIGKRLTVKLAYWQTSAEWMDVTLRLYAGEISTEERVEVVHKNANEFLITFPTIGVETPPDKIELTFRHISSSRKFSAPVTLDWVRSPDPPDGSGGWVPRAQVFRRPQGIQSTVTVAPDYVTIELRSAAPDMMGGTLHVRAMGASMLPDHNGIVDATRKSREVKQAISFTHGRFTLRLPWQSQRADLPSDGLWLIEGEAWDIWGRRTTFSEIIERAQVVQTLVPPYLTVEPDALVFALPGEEIHLKTYAYFTMGGRKSVDGLSSGTTYSTSNLAVATVSASGVVKAIGHGKADITVFFSGQTRKIPVEFR